MYYNKNVNKILYGTEPKENEVAISLAIADELLVEFSNCCNTYDDLFNLTIDNGEYSLVGIVEGNHKMIYISEADYVENITSYKYIDDNNARYYKYEKKYDSYEIVMGRDLNENDFNTANILIPDKFIGYENIVGTDVLGVGFVVGVYRIKNADYSSYEIMINANDTSNQYLEYKYSYNVENYHLVEGRKPENDSECVISIYNEKEIGDSVDGYKIVGRYNGSTQVLKAKALFSTSVLSIDDYSRKVFIVDDEEKLLESISNTTFELKDMYQHEYDRQKKINQEELTIYGILGSICLIAASIMVLFLMRSKMINDIYNIGVYRSLGSSKSKIYLKYFTDTLVMVTFTSLVAYISVMFIYYTAIDSINDFWGLELFSRSFIIPLIGIAILYIINIFFGLLPIFTLLKKTPSEIIAKYDI
jgi:ABC-type antimicrobial peptide transport system permease subunit